MCIKHRSYKLIQITWQSLFLNAFMLSTRYHSSRIINWKSSASKSLLGCPCSLRTFSYTKLIKKRQIYERSFEPTYFFIQLLNILFDWISTLWMSDNINWTNITSVSFKPNDFTVSEKRLLGAILISIDLWCFFAYLPVIWVKEDKV